jgi:hypothetical protein
MKDHDIKIRANSTSGADLTFEQAVELAAGTDPRVGRVAVTAVYAEDGDQGTGGRPGPHKAGEPVWALDAEVQCRQVRFGEDADATVNISGWSSHSTELAAYRILCYTLATRIAVAANKAAAAAKTSAA